MAQNNNLEQQFVVSKELIQLLKWLVEHEPDNMKKVVQQALEDGLQDDIQSEDRDASNEDMQQSIVDFFSLIENILYEVYREEGSSQSRPTFPELNHVDVHLCDHNTLAVSAAKASSALQDNEETPPSAKEALSKALITYWTPDKSRSVH